MEKHFEAACGCEQERKLSEVSDAGLIGELLRRQKRVSHAAGAHEETPALSAAVDHVAQSAGLIFNRPAPATDPTTGQPIPVPPRFPNVRKLLDGLFASASPIILDWVVKNLPALLGKILPAAAADHKAAS